MGVRAIQQFANALVDQVVEEYPEPDLVLNATGGTVVPDGNAPGFDYDPTVDRFVGWVSGQTVYSLAMETRTWEVHNPTNAVDPGQPNDRGTFGRFRYMPARNAFILVNRVDENVFFYKLSPGQPPPDTVAPSAPTNVVVR